MTFAAGQSGNPGGRRAEKPWRDAISAAARQVLAGDPDGRTKLRVIAEKLVEQAMEGDIQSAKEIGDRLDGKAIQQISGDGDDGALVVKIVRLAEEK